MVVVIKTKSSSFMYCSCIGCSNLLEYHDAVTFVLLPATHDGPGLCFACVTVCYPSLGSGSALLDLKSSAGNVLARRTNTCWSWSLVSLYDGSDIEIYYCTLELQSKLATDCEEGQVLQWMEKPEKGASNSSTVFTLLNLDPQRE